jgi:transposase
MQRSAAAERAGCALALLLFALAWPARERALERCAHPVVRSRGEVACAPGPAGLPRLEGPLRRLFEQPIDPNLATPTTLETLPGIGAARAAAIVRERCRRRFTSIGELRRVRGLGPKRIAAIEPFLGIETRLAPEGRAPVKSSTCRSSCENGGAPVPNGPGCRTAQTAEAPQ